MGWLKQFMISWPYMDNAATNLDPYCSKNEEDEGAYYHYLEHFLSHFLLMLISSPESHNGPILSLWKYLSSARLEF